MWHKIIKFYLGTIIIITILLSFKMCKIYITPMYVSLKTFEMYENKH